MAPRRRLLHLLAALALRAALAGAAAAVAHAYDRVNLLVSHLPMAGPDGPARYERVTPYGPRSVAELGDALLFLDPYRHRILRLREGRITVFAGNGEPGSRIDPDAPLGTALGRPRVLLVLRDQSVLVSHEWARQPGPNGEVVVRIRTRPRPGEPTVSLFAGNRQARGAVDPASALRTPIRCVGDLAEEPDGAILLSDYDNHRVLRVRTDGTVETVAGTGVPGRGLAPASGPATQLNHPHALVALKDGSVLIADTQNTRILRVRQGAVTVYAGQAPGAEHPMPLAYVQALSALPDGSVAMMERGWDDWVHRMSYRLVHFTTGRASLIAGRDLGNLPLDPQHCPGLALHSASDHVSLAPLGDGSLVIGLAPFGLRLLSPPDALQTTLEELVTQGKAAVQAGDLAAYRRAALALAYLCAPASQALRAADHAAHDLGRLEPRALEARLHLPPELVKAIQDQAEPHWTERLRAQLALRELRRYRKERLGRWPAPAEHAPESLP